MHRFHLLESSLLSDEESEYYSYLTVSCQLVEAGLMAYASLQA